MYWVLCSPSLELSWMSLMFPLRTNTQVILDEGPAWWSYVNLMTAAKTLSLNKVTFTSAGDWTSTSLLGRHSWPYNGQVHVFQILRGTKWEIHTKPFYWDLISGAISRRSIWMKFMIFFQGTLISFETSDQPWFRLGCLSDIFSKMNKKSLSLQGKQLSFVASDKIQPFKGK